MKQAILRIDAGQVVWAFLIASGMQFVVFRLGTVAILLLFHTVLGAFSPSYRESLEDFGGWTGYIETQLVPRLMAGISSDWGRFLLRSLLSGVGALVICTVYAEEPSKRRIGLALLLLGLMLYTSWRTWLLTPIWGIINTLQWGVVVGGTAAIITRYILPKEVRE